jgi:predicted transcriptional regulator
LKLSGVKGTTIHRLLHLLVHEGTQLDTTACKLTKSHNQPFTRWFKVIKPLIDQEFIRYTHNWFNITSEGRDHYYELEAKSPMARAPRKRQLVPLRDQDTYQGEHDAAIRPGANDFLAIPSLRGNRRYFRDGRFEVN